MHFFTLTAWNHEKKIIMLQIHNDAYIITLYITVIPYGFSFEEHTRYVMASWDQPITAGWWYKPKVIISSLTKQLHKCTFHRMEYASGEGLESWEALGAARGPWRCGWIRYHLQQPCPGLGRVLGDLPRLPDDLICSFPHTDIPAGYVLFQSSSTELWSSL